VSTLLGGLLGRVSGGSIQVDIDSVPFASMDGQSRDLNLQIDPLLRRQRGSHLAMGHGGPLELWSSRRIPTELARRGWRLTLYDGTDELLVFGRGTSPLTGHIHLNPAALWRLRKLL
jgi:hypothetical protein